MTETEGRRSQFMRRAAQQMGAAAMAMTLFAATACHKNKPPVARPTPPPTATGTTAVAAPPAPPTPVNEPIIVPPEPVREDAITSASLDDLNRNSPLKPAFFEFDSAELTPTAQTALQEDSSILKKYGTWTITIEGHCDERGTAEYN